MLVEMVTLESAKRQLRIDLDIYDYDVEVEDCIDDAVSVASEFLQRAIPFELDDTTSPPTGRIPGGVRRALLYMITEFYTARKQGNVVDLMHPNSVAVQLLFPYRAGMGV